MRGPRISTVLFVGGLAVAACVASAHSARAGGDPVATLDVDSAFIPVLEAAVWVGDEPEVTVPVALDRTATSPGSLSWTAWNGSAPTNGSIQFPIGSTSGSYSFGFGAGAGVLVAPGWEFTDVLTYVHSGAGVEVGFPNQMHAGRIVEVGSASTERGSLCFYELLETIWCLVFPPACPGALLDGSDTLRRYRDEILATTPEGQYYIDKYVEHSVAMARAAFREPDFLARFVRMQDSWVAAFDALVNGNGSAATVTPAMRDDLLSLLDSLEANGSPELAADLAFERQRLQLDTIAGLTIAQFQSQVETLGGATSVEPSSWGRMKSLYR